MISPSAIQKCLTSILLYSSCEVRTGYRHGRCRDEATIGELLHALARGTHFRTSVAPALAPESSYSMDTASAARSGDRRKDQDDEAAGNHGGSRIGGRGSLEGRGRK